jgi:hypothetical protein
MIIKRWGKAQSSKKTVDRAACVIENAVRKLLQQHKYSNGYLSECQSEIAEANIVIHIAAGFLESGCRVWAESPFRTHENKNCKRVDLMVDMASDDPDYSSTQGSPVGATVLPRDHWKHVETFVGSSKQ